MTLALECKNQVVWECTIGNKKKWKPNELLETHWQNDSHNLPLIAQWHDRDKNLVKFSWQSDHFFSEILEHFGKIPLPPYMNRESETSDTNNYQTVYSKHKGAVAAPTAGLHFTERVMDSLKESGHELSFLTLHVGAGTFMPVKTENALHHPMHCEQLVFSLKFIENLCNNTEKVIAVGTTSMRSLESLYWFGCKLINDKDSDFFIEKLFPYESKGNFTAAEALNSILQHMKTHKLEVLHGYTEIMIFPGYEFKICKGLITNFHQPESTLLLLVAALIGTETWKKIYHEASKLGYRFLSYGDSSLLLKN
jgi:S-adenosylmethionine:tRNA ribosyltransferase-isomerase